MSASQRAKRRTKSMTNPPHGSSSVWDRRARRAGDWPKRGWKAARLAEQRIIRGS